MARTVSLNVAYSRIEWKVENIFSGGSEESEAFRFRTSTWRLTLDRTTLEGTESLRILLVETGGKHIFSDFMTRVFIADENHTPQFFAEQVCKVSSTGYYRDYVWTMNVKDLLRKDGILSKENFVSFVCFLMPKDEHAEVSTQTAVSMETVTNLECLSRDFYHLLDNNILSDVTLKCGDLSILAHRNALSGRSEVFAAMFRNDMAESRSGIIEISDVDPPVLKHLLQFIYSCKLPDMSMDTATQLYEAADKYGVESLKTVCSAFMTENLTEENVCGILILADAHSDTDLKGGAVSFIVKTKLFQEDDIWLKFCQDHPKLAVEVLNRVCKTVSCSV